MDILQRLRNFRWGTCARSDHQELNRPNQRWGGWFGRNRTGCLPSGQAWLLPADVRLPVGTRYACARDRPGILAPRSRPCIPLQETGVSGGNQMVPTMLLYVLPMAEPISISEMSTTRATKTRIMAYSTIPCPPSRGKNSILVTPLRLGASVPSSPKLKPK